MKVLVHDPYLPPDFVGSRGVTGVSLDELLINSDFVTIHVPLTPETKHMLIPDCVWTDSRD